MCNVPIQDKQDFVLSFLFQMIEKTVQPLHKQFRVDVVTLKKCLNTLPSGATTCRAVLFPCRLKIIIGGTNIPEALPQDTKLLTPLSLMDSARIRCLPFVPCTFRARF